MRLQTTTLAIAAIATASTWAQPVGNAVEVFTTADTLCVPYRIPAIACTGSGKLVAVADYRHSRTDIGVLKNGKGEMTDGEIDIHCRISTDNGLTWGETIVVADGLGARATDAFHVGYGDPAIVADWSSDDVAMLCCSGDVSFFAGTRQNHQGIAAFHSADGGLTWDEPFDLAESFYSQLDSNSSGPVCALFVGSGKIHQSRAVQVGGHKRLYCAVLVRASDKSRRNYVFYSDDFGRSWTLLGDPDTPAIPQGGDEPKVEELPSGDVVISSRIRGGRAYNFFTFTDAASGQGTWGEMAISDESCGGTVAENNSTNGEILIIPALRTADGTPTWVALQSVPFGPGRNNVGIYYKELASAEDYATPKAFAADWDGRYQVSFTGSAYSTMVMQADGKVAFFYEEDTYKAVSGGGFTLIYAPIALETITGGALAVPTKP